MEGAHTSTMNKTPVAVSDADTQSNAYLILFINSGLLVVGKLKARFIYFSQYKNLQPSCLF